MIELCGSPHPDTPPLPGSKPGMTRDTVITAERTAFGPLGVIWYRRLAGHAGDHAAFGFSIMCPITWPAEAIDLDEEVS